MNEARKEMKKMTEEKRSQLDDTTEMILEELSQLPLEEKKNAFFLIKGMTAVADLPAQKADA